MDALLVAVPALGCALMMVPMMWFMARGMNQGGRSSAGHPGPREPVGPGRRDAEVAELQAEVDRLRAEVRAQDSGMARQPERP